MHVANYELISVYDDAIKHSYAQLDISIRNLRHREQHNRRLVDDGLGNRYADLLAKNIGECLGRIYRMREQREQLSQQENKELIMSAFRATITDGRRNETFLFISEATPETGLLADAWLNMPQEVEDRFPRECGMWCRQIEDNVGNIVLAEVL